MLQQTKFGRLQVLKQDFSILPSPRNAYNTFWKCQCDCGNFLTVRRCSLISGNTKSCGCLQKETVKKNGFKTRFQKGSNQKYSSQEAILRQLYREYQYRAKNKNMNFSLSFEEFNSTINQNCFYCGRSPSQKKYQIRSKINFILYNGIDRLDINKGYEKDNMVPCCSLCNIAKGTMTKRQFFDWITKVHHHLTINNIL